MSTIVNLTKEALDVFITEAKKEKNMGQIKRNIMDPLIDYTFRKLYPYIVITSLLFLLTFILAICILYMLIRKNINSN
jgi:hypothetical protein